MSENTIDQQFIEYVVKTLVENPDAVSIERTIDEKGVLLLLTVDPEDLGRVIGKRGATAQSMRTLLRALGTKNESRYNLKIVDNGYPKPERDEAYSRENSSKQENSNDSSSSEDDTRRAEERTSMQKPAKPGEEKPAESAFEKSDFASDVKEEAPKVEEESAIERTRRELEDLDDLDI